MNKTIKVGIIGCGGIANGKHMPALRNIGKDMNIEMVAFCDIIKERAERAFKQYGNENSKVYTDYKEMLKDKDIDTVHVCTPNLSHCNITIDALKADKHVMCEKPMAKTAEDAKKMLDTAKETGKILTVAYQNRFRPDSIYLKQACDNGDLGEIYFAKGHALRRRAVPTWGVFLNEHEQGGGPLIDIGTHALDLSLWFMNNYKPKMVVGTSYHKLNNQTQTANAWGDWNPKEFSVEDSAFGFIVMEDGATIILESSWALNTLEVDEAKASLCGTKAGADMKDGLRINSVKYNKQVVEKPGLDPAGVDFYDASGDNLNDNEAKAFYNSVINQAEIVVKPEQAYIVTLILEAIYKSAKTGKPVYFNDLEV